MVEIFINPEDNKPPVIEVLEALVVEESGTTSINASTLAITDVDSMPTSLVVVIERPPMHGRITRYSTGKLFFGNCRQISLIIQFYLLVLQN